jgi:hypothetical protein
MTIFELVYAYFINLKDWDQYSWIYKKINEALKILDGLIQTYKQKQCRVTDALFSTNDFLKIGNTGYQFKY